jgi:hypothetical protein
MTARLPRDYALEYSRRRRKLASRVETPERAEARRAADRARRAAHTLTVSATPTSRTCVVACNACGPLTTTVEITAAAIAGMQAAHRRDVGAS